MRTPSRIERGGSVTYAVADLGFDFPAPGFPSIAVLRFDTPALGNERVDAIDVGWRHQFNSTASFDLTLFHARHTRQRGASLEEEMELMPGYWLFAPLSNNHGRANISGLEASVDWRPARDWRLQAHYSWLRDRIYGDPVESNYDGITPRHQFSLRSSLDLNERLQWDAWLRYVSDLEVPDVPAYTTLDMRLAWKVDRNLTLSLVGLNLLDRQHPEFGNFFVNSRESEIERSFYVRADWKF